MRRSHLLTATSIEVLDDTPSSLVRFDVLEVELGVIARHSGILRTTLFTIGVGIDIHVSLVLIIRKGCCALVAYVSGVHLDCTRFGCECDPLLWIYKSFPVSSRGRFSDFRVLSGRDFTTVLFAFLYRASAVREVTELLEGNLRQHR